MTTIKTLGVLTPMRQSVSFCIVIMLVLVFLTIKPSFGKQLKFSSKYNDKDLTQIVKERRINSNFNDTNGPSAVGASKTNISNLGKYVKDIYNYIKQDHSFVETRKDLHPNFPNAIQNQISYSSDKTWTKKVAECVKNKGLIVCLKIFLLRRIDRVNDKISESKADQDVSIVFDDVVEEIQNDFKWEVYNDLTEKDLDTLVIRKFQKLAQKKRLKLVLRSGAVIEIKSNGTATVQFDIQKESGSRGMKMKKIAYRIIPILFLPGLLFSSLLPFILPALKLMVIGAGILNQVALMGSIFTLLRNNIFNDKYETKVVYLNEGYKNELHSDHYGHHHHRPHYGEHKKRKYIKRRYPSLTTPKFDEFHEESNRFHEQYIKPQSLIDDDVDDVYSQEYHNFYNRGRYDEFDDVQRKEGNDFYEPVSTVASPLRRSTKRKTYSVRIRPHYNGDNY